MILVFTGGRPGTVQWKRCWGYGLVFLSFPYPGVMRVKSDRVAGGRGIICEEFIVHLLTVQGRVLGVVNAHQSRAVMLTSFDTGCMA